jgi:hypothetical protein
LTLLPVLKIYRTETPGLEACNTGANQPPNWRLACFDRHWPGYYTAIGYFGSLLFTNGSFDLNKWGLSLPGMGTKPSYNAAFLFETLG